MKPDEVKQLRAAADLTQTELARLMGLGKAGQITVSYWESGRRNISAPHANLLKRVCAEAKAGK